MKQLEDRLKTLQKSGYQTIEITMIMQWIAEIRRLNRLKNSKAK